MEDETQQEETAGPVINWEEVTRDDNALEVSDLNSYSSDSSDDEDNLNKRKRQKWTEVRDFACLEQAQSYLKEEGTYSTHYRDKNLLTFYYRCNKVQRRAKVQCSSRAKLVVCKKTAVVSLFTTANEHDHHLMEQPKRGIPDATKEVMRTLVCQGMNPKQIKEQLKEKRIKCPKKRQLSAFVSMHRRQIFGPRRAKVKVSEASGMIVGDDDWGGGV